VETSKDQKVKEMLKSITIETCRRAVLPQERAFCDTGKDIYDLMERVKIVYKDDIERTYNKVYMSSLKKVMTNCFTAFHHEGKVKEVVMNLAVCSVQMTSFTNYYDLKDQSTCGHFDNSPTIIQFWSSKDQKINTYPQKHYQNQLDKV
jgi:hypothetical protein